MWGYLKFLKLRGIKPNPFFPIIAPSKICTLSSIIEFLIMTLEPMQQLLPILTLFSIIVL